MNNRQRALAVLNYQTPDRLPLVHFGYWRALLEQWAAQGHLTPAEAAAWADSNPVDHAISARLGFDFNWYSVFSWRTLLFPPLERKVLEERPDGSQLVLNKYAQVVIEKPGITSIATEVDHLLKGPREWREFFLPRLQFSAGRYLHTPVMLDGLNLPYDQGGLELMAGERRSSPLGLFCGSLLGEIRNWLGVTGLSYLMVDNAPFLDEIITTVSDLSFQGVQAILATGARFDFAHFWEDMCYKNGPLVNPRWFESKIAPHYRRITELLNAHDIRIVSVDCDGKIDALIPIWLANGVNTMFPIEVGTWKAEIAPWRAKYGRDLRGVGGVDKKIFLADRPAVDAEIERLRPLVALGGYIPCIDHRLPLDAKWELVAYYCDRMRRVFG